MRLRKSFAAAEHAITAPQRNTLITVSKGRNGKVMVLLCGKIFRYWQLLEEKVGRILSSKNAHVQDRP